MMRRLAPTVLILAFLVAIAAVTPASAGGSWFDNDQLRYSPGDEATVVGYTGGGAYGWVDDGPFFAWLTGNSNWVEAENSVDPAYMHYLGPITIHESSKGYPRLRLSITFTLPDDLVDGIYGFNYCNASCDEQIGDLIGGTIFVGDDTEGAQPPQWVPWEPLLTGEPLPDHVVLVGETPSADFVPPEPSGIWWTGNLDAQEKTETTTTTSTTTTTPATTTTSTAPAITETAAGLGAGTTGSSDDSSAQSRLALGALAVGAVGLVVIASRRRRSLLANP